MAKEYAKPFYNSKKWRRISKKYLDTQYRICERCGNVANVVHHKEYITPENIKDPMITFDWKNLEALCNDCHNKEHKAEYAEIRSDVMFDENGNVVGSTTR